MLAMGMRNTPSRWGWLAQFLHWATALLIIMTIPVGWWANSLERGPTERALFDVHFGIGVLIFGLVGGRLLWRAFDSAPKMPPDASPVLARAAKASHFFLYATLLTMIVSGYVIQVHMRPALDVFGLLQIPRPFEPGEDESLRALAWYVHTYALWVLGALIALHTTAALWHHLVWRDDALSRMLPFTKGETFNVEQHETEADAVAS